MKEYSEAFQNVDSFSGWGIFSLSAWLPTYIVGSLGLSLTNSALLSLLPPVSWLASDYDMKSGLSLKVNPVDDLTVTSCNQSCPFRPPPFSSLPT